MARKASRKMPRPGLVDLHVHSNASDGVYGPRDVVRIAAEVGLKAVALADHDTVAGIDEALAAGTEFGIEVVPALEISAEFEDGACHILGYFLDHRDRGLVDALAEAQRGRDRRNREILRRLRALGFGLSMADLVRRAEGGSITRAHFAAALLEKGRVQTWDEAFDKYLSRGRPAFVYRRRIVPADAIRVVHGAGGLAFLAHPRQLNRDAAETAALIQGLAHRGLDGLETQSADHSRTYARQYRQLARRLGLLESGGTDWHGRADAKVRIGVGTGQVRVPYEVVEAMKRRLAERPPVRGA